jgi:hypothetical protein
MFHATKEQRRLVLYMAATGCPLTEIARAVGCDTGTLHKYFQEELTNGRDMVTSKIAVGVVSRAMRAFTAHEQPGDLSCARWYMGLWGGPNWKMNPREQTEVQRLEDESQQANQVQVYIPENHREHLEDVEQVTIEGEAEDSAAA